MTLGVVLPIPPALAGPEPGDTRHLGVAGAGGVQHGARHRAPLRPLLGADHPPAVGREPIPRGAVDHARRRAGVDPEVVPIHEEHQVPEPQPPGRVLGLVGRPGGEPALALDDEDLHLRRPGPLEGQGLAGGGGHAVARGAGVELEEEGPPLHLGVPGQPAAAAEPEQPLPGEGEVAALGEREAGIGAALVARPQPLVEHGEGGVDEGHRVPGAQHESISEPEPGPPDVPAHGSTEQEGEEEMDLGTGTPGVAALPVVEGEVDALVDDILHGLEAGEVRLRQGVEPGHVTEAAGPPASAARQLLNGPHLTSIMGRPTIRP